APTAMPPVAPAPASAPSSLPLPVPPDAVLAAGESSTDRRVKLAPNRPDSRPQAQTQLSGTVPGESRRTGVPRRVPELVLDPKELVVLRHPLRPGRRPGLDLTGTHRDREIRDGGVFGLARPVAHHAPEPGPVRQ